MNNQGRLYSNEEIKQIVMINGDDELKDYIEQSPRRVKDYIDGLLNARKRNEEDKLIGEEL